MAPSTLVPFLYHTRTLQMFARTRVPTPALQAFFHSSPRQHFLSAAQQPTPEHFPQIPVSGQQGKRLRKSPTLRSASHDSSVPFEGLEFEEEDDPEVLRRSTITVKERDAFDRIFEEIAMRKRAPIAPAPTGNPMPGNFSPDQQQAQSSKPEQAARQSINVIIKDAETHASMQNGFHLQQHIMGQVSASKKAPSDPERALMRFPPSLRKAAKLALGVLDRDRQTQDINILQESVTAPIHEPDLAGTDTFLDEIADNRLADKIAIDTLRSTERKRVEAMMLAAKTDFELWDILEKEVFSMVAKLGISGDSSPSIDGVKKVKKKRIVKKRNAVLASGTAGKEATGETLPDGKLSMNIHGPLYPSYLLFALRLLDQSFARPSPMTLNLLPRIKELGLMSFVLGVSSPFYNTLARILWYRYGDAKAVLELLEEMRHVGLHCDGTTQSVIFRIQEYLKDTKSGMHGPFVAEIVDGYDYEVNMKSRLREWNLFIGKQLEERSSGLVFES
ncbi:hypothetical protein V8F20_007094 [Naviculisporaceae sp. PSN 640]